jgi:GT2 family glycosyltransferase
VTPPLASVVVVNLSRRDLIERCLESLWSQQFDDFEVVVVDNGSTDDSLQYLHGVGDPRLVVVSLDRNHGFAGGANAGIRAARGRYVATLNNDAEAAPGWLAALVGCLAANPELGMAASKIVLANDRDRIDKVGHLIYPDGLNHGRGSGQLDVGQFEEPAEVLFPDGAAAIYRRTMLDEIGLFDERFFAYGDDADLGLRGRLAGWSCLYRPDAVVHHIHSATAGEFSPMKAFLIERNRIWVAVKLWPVRLLVVTQFYTLVRLLFQAYGAARGQGSSGRFATDSTPGRVLGAFVRAYLSGIRGIGQFLESRRQVRRVRKVSDSEFLVLLRRHRLRLRDLA